MVIALCQPDYESLVEQELLARGILTQDRGSGWLQATDVPPGPDWLKPGLCFAHRLLLAPLCLRGDSVNALAHACGASFLESARHEHFEGTWPLLATHAELTGLGRRARAVEKAMIDLLRRRMPRVMKLAIPDAPRGIARCRGLFLHFVDFDRAFFAREAVFGGQRRMADDPAAPSRSYLKAEEAYVVLGREPSPGDTVVDLGAAPGGWSYGAANRGARVTAIDNGPLKGGALGHPLITHVRQDAFDYRPAAPVDWLLCDMVEEPHHVLRAIVEPWITERLCRNLVVNLKMGRASAIDLLSEILSPSSVLVTHTKTLRVRHLFHDREEITIVAEVSPRFA